jgi:YhcH/YjgK/YiaL family protein
MLDIQIPLSGPETYGYIPLAKLPDIEYNEAKDITKYPEVQAESYVTCLPGEFAIFFPQDGHAPCISKEESIKKAIFKVKA